MDVVSERILRGSKQQIVYKSLDAAMLRSKANAQNIANVDVPAYQRQEVSFESELRKAMKIQSKGALTDERHIEISKEARIRKVKAEAYRPVDPSQASGQNNVDIDIENAKMAENQILYNYAVRFASFQKLNSAISSKPM